MTINHETKENQSINHESMIYIWQPSIDDGKLQIEQLIVPYHNIKSRVEQKWIITINKSKNINKIYVYLHRDVNIFRTVRLPSVG